MIDEEFLRWGVYTPDEIREKHNKDSLDEEEEE